MEIVKEVEYTNGMVLGYVFKNNNMLLFTGILVNVILNL